MSKPAIERAASRAGAYVEKHGGDRDRALLEVLDGQRSGLAFLEALAAVQEPYGALPRWRDGASEDPVRCCAHALQRLDGLGLLDHPVVEAAVGFLARTQDEDGGFGSGADDDARVEHSGRVTGLLAKTPFARRSALERAELYLTRHWSVDRVQGPHYETILAYAPVMTLVPSDEADGILQWCGRELERGFRAHQFPAVAVARVHLHARARALPGASIDPDELIIALQTEQTSEGHWPDLPGHDPVDSALDGLEALLRLS